MPAARCLVASPCSSTERCPSAESSPSPSHPASSAAAASAAAASREACASPCPPPSSMVLPACIGAADAANFVLLTPPGKVLPSAAEQAALDEALGCTAPPDYAYSPPVARVRRRLFAAGGGDDDDDEDDVVDSDEAPVSDASDDDDDAAAVVVEERAEASSGAVPLVSVPPRVLTHCHDVANHKHGGAQQSALAGTATGAAAAAFHMHACQRRNAGVPGHVHHPRHQHAAGHAHHHHHHHHHHRHAPPPPPPRKRRTAARRGGASDGAAAAADPVVMRGGATGGARSGCGSGAADRPLRVKPVSKRSAYQLFAMAEHKQLVQQLPDADFATRSRLVGAAWRSLSAPERAAWEADALTDAERCEQDYLDQEHAYITSGISSWSRSDDDAQQLADLSRRVGAGSARR